MSHISIKQWHHPSRCIWVKTISLLVILTFIFPYLTWALEVQNYSGMHTILFNQRLLEIPKKFGTTKHAWQHGEKMVVHIQDLHCNYEVQKNIAGIIHELARKHNLRLLAVEGASLPINTTKLRSFPIKKVRDDVSDYFVRQGKLSGAEYYAITSEFPMALEGIETAELYALNKRSVEFILTDEGQGYCLDLRDNLNIFKPQIYSSTLLAFDKKRVAYREGRVSALKYCRGLRKYAKKLKLDLNPFPNFIAYSQSHDAVFPLQIEADDLFQEIDRLDQIIREYFYTNKIQRDLDAQLKRLDIIEKLLSISVSPEELAVFRQERQAFQVQTFVDFIWQQNTEDDVEIDPEVFVLDGYLDAAVDFYRVADQRSEQLAKNTLARLQKHNTKIAVLVTGGYHTEHVLAALEAQGVSYISIKPKITEQDVVNPYFSLLRNRQTPLEKLLSQNQKVFTLEPLLPKMADPNKIPDEATDLDERERTFSRLADLILTAMTAMYHFLRNKLGAGLARRVQEAMADYPDLLVTGKIKIHPNQTISFWVQAPGGQEMLVVCTPGNRSLPIIEAEALQVAEFKQEKLVFVGQGKAAAVRAKLDAVPAGLWAEMNLREIDALYPARSILFVLVTWLDRCKQLIAEWQTRIHAIGAELKDWPGKYLPQMGVVQIEGTDIFLPDVQWPPWLASMMEKADTYMRNAEMKPEGLAGKYSDKSLPLKRDAEINHLTGKTGREKLQELLLAKNKQKLYAKVSGNPDKHLFRSTESTVGQYIGDTDVNGAVTIRAGKKFPALGSKGAGWKVYLKKIRILNDQVMEFDIRLEKNGATKIRRFQIDMLLVNEKTGFFEIHDRLALHCVIEMIQQAEDVDWPAFMEKKPDLRGLTFGELKKGKVNVRANGKDFALHLSGENEDGWENHIVDYGYEQDTPFIEVKLTRGPRVKFRRFAIRGRRQREQVFDIQLVAERQYLHGIYLDKNVCRQLFSKNRNLEAEVQACSEYIREIGLKAVPDKRDRLFYAQFEKYGFDPLVVEVALEAYLFGRTENGRLESELKKEILEKPDEHKHFKLSKTIAAELSYVQAADSPRKQLASIAEPRGIKVMSELLDPQAAALPANGATGRLWEKDYGDDLYIGQTNKTGGIHLFGKVAISPVRKHEPGWDVFLRKAKCINDHVIEVSFLAKKDEEEITHSFQIDTKRVNKSTGALEMEYRLGLQYVADLLTGPGNAGWETYLESLPDLKGVSLGILNIRKLSVNVRGEIFHWHLIGERESGWEARLQGCKYVRGAPRLTVLFKKGDRIKIRHFRIDGWREKEKCFDIKVAVEQQYYYGVLLNQRVADYLFSDERDVHSEMSKSISALQEQRAAILAGEIDPRKLLISQGCDLLVAELALQAWKKNRVQRNRIPIYRIFANQVKGTAKKVLKLTYKKMAEVYYKKTNQSDTAELVAISLPEGVDKLLELLKPKEAKKRIRQSLRSGGTRKLDDYKNIYLGQTGPEGEIFLKKGHTFSALGKGDAGWDTYITEARVQNNHVITLEVRLEKQGQIRRHTFQIDTQRFNKRIQALEILPQLGLDYIMDMLSQTSCAVLNKYLRGMPELEGLLIGDSITQRVERAYGDTKFRWSLIGEKSPDWKVTLNSVLPGSRPRLQIKCEKAGRTKIRTFEITDKYPGSELLNISLVEEKQYYYGVYLSKSIVEYLLNKNSAILSQVDACLRAIEDNPVKSELASFLADRGFDEVAIHLAGHRAQMGETGAVMLEEPVELEEALITAQKQNLKLAKYRDATAYYQRQTLPGAGRSKRLLAITSLSSKLWDLLDLRTAQAAIDKHLTDSEPRLIPEYENTYIGRTDENGKNWFDSDTHLSLLGIREERWKGYLENARVCNDHVIELKLRFEKHGQTEYRVFQIDTLKINKQNKRLAIHYRLGWDYIADMLAESADVDWSDYFQKLRQLEDVSLGRLQSLTLAKKIHGENYIWALLGGTEIGWDARIVRCELDDNVPSIWLEFKKGNRVKYRNFKIIRKNEDEATHAIQLAGEKYFYRGIEIYKRLIPEVYLAHDTFAENVEKAMAQLGELSSELLTMTRITQLRTQLVKLGYSPLVAAVAAQAAHSVIGKVHEKKTFSDFIRKPEITKRQIVEYNGSKMAELQYSITRAPGGAEHCTLAAISSLSGVDKMLEILDPEHMRQLLASGRKNFLEYANTYIGKSDSSGQVYLKHGVNAPGLRTMETDWDVYVNRVTALNDHIFEVQMRLEKDGKKIYRPYQFDVLRINKSTGTLRRYTRLGWEYITDMLSQPENIDWQSYLQARTDIIGLRLSNLNCNILLKLIRGVLYSWQVLPESYETGWEGKIIACELGPHGPRLGIELTKGARRIVRRFEVTPRHIEGGFFGLRFMDEKQYYHNVYLNSHVADTIFSSTRDIRKQLESCLTAMNTAMQKTAGPVLERSDIWRKLIEKGFAEYVIAFAWHVRRLRKNPGLEISANKVVRKVPVSLPGRCMAELRYSLRSKETPLAQGGLISLTTATGLDKLGNLINYKKAKKLIARNTPNGRPVVLPGYENHYLGKTEEDGAIYHGSQYQASLLGSVEAGWDVYLDGAQVVNNHVIEIKIRSEKDGGIRYRTYQIDLYKRNKMTGNLEIHYRLGWEYIADMLIQSQHVDWEDYFETAPELHRLSFGIYAGNAIIRQVNGKIFQWTHSGQQGQGMEGKILVCETRNNEPHFWVEFKDDKRSMIREFRIADYDTKNNRFNILLVNQEHRYFGQPVSVAVDACLAAINKIRANARKTARRLSSARLWEMLLGRNFKPEVVEQAVRLHRVARKSPVDSAARAAGLGFSARRVLMELPEPQQKLVLELMRSQWIDIKAFCGTLDAIPLIKRTPEAFVRILAKHISKEEGVEFFTPYEQKQMQNISVSRLCENAWVWEYVNSLAASGYKITGSTLRIIINNRKTSRKYLKKYVKLMRKYNISQTDFAKCYSSARPWEEIKEILPLLSATELISTNIAIILSSALTKKEIRTHLDLFVDIDKKTLRANIQQIIHDRRKTQLHQIISDFTKAGMLSGQQSNDIQTAIERKSHLLSTDFARDIFAALQYQGEPWFETQKIEDSQKLLGIDKLWQKRAWLIKVHALAEEKRQDGISLDIILKVLYSPLSMKAIEKILAQHGPESIERLLDKYLYADHSSGVEKQELIRLLEKNSIRDTVQVMAINSYRNTSRIIRILGYLENIPANILDKSISASRLDDIKTAIFTKCLRRTAELSDLVDYLPKHNGSDSDEQYHGRLLGVIQDTFSKNKLSEMRRVLQLLVRFRGKLPVLTENAAQKAREYIKLRRILRQLDPDQLFGLLDIIMGDKLSAGEIAQLKRNIISMMQKDREQWETIKPEFQKILIDRNREGSKDIQLLAGQLLLSFDSEVRRDIEDTVINVFVPRIFIKYKQPEYVETAVNTLARTLRRYDVYKGLLEGAETARLTSFIYRNQMFVGKEASRVRYADVFRAQAEIIAKAEEKDVYLSETEIFEFLAIQFSSPRLQSFKEYLIELKSEKTEPLTKVNADGYEYECGGILDKGTLDMASDYMRSIYNFTHPLTDTDVDDPDAIGGYMPWLKALLVERWGRLSADTYNRWAWAIEAVPMGLGGLPAVSIAIWTGYHDPLSLALLFIQAGWGAFFLEHLFPKTAAGWKALISGNVKKAYQDFSREDWIKVGIAFGLAAFNLLLTLAAPGLWAGIVVLVIIGLGSHALTNRILKTKQTPEPIEVVQEVTTEIPDRQINRSLLETRPVMFKLIQFLMTPRLQLRPWLRPLRLFGGVVLGLVKVAGYLYLSIRNLRAKSGADTATISQVRKYQLVLPDAISARQLNPEHIRIQTRGSAFGSYRYENGKLDIFVPQVLVNQQNAGKLDRFLFDIAVWTQAMRCHNEILQEIDPALPTLQTTVRYQQLPQRILKNILRFSRALPVGLTRGWHGFWLKRHPVQYLQAQLMQATVQSDMAEQLVTSGSTLRQDYIRFSQQPDKTNAGYFMESVIDRLQLQREYIQSLLMENKLSEAEYQKEQLVQSVNTINSLMRTMQILQGRPIGKKLDNIQATPFGEQRLWISPLLRSSQLGAYLDVLDFLGLKVDRKDLWQWRKPARTNANAA
ncbi:hypothetical protein KAR34_05635 [bacterium]|nr:hypothetical protein [bacterium]